MRMQGTGAVPRQLFVAVIWIVTGCTSAGPSLVSSLPDASMDGREVTDAGMGVSDAPAAPCNVAPYPNGLACNDPTAACVPEAGFDCCRCLTTTNCKYPNQWACESSHPRCPATPPILGTTCSLPQYAGCIYCDQTVAVVACTNGTWQAVDNHLYCQVSD
jgi:hypothetical protein